MLSIRSAFGLLREGTRGQGTASAKAQVRTEARKSQGGVHLQSAALQGWGRARQGSSLAGVRSPRWPLQAGRPLGGLLHQGRWEGVCPDPGKRGRGRQCWRQ